MKHLISLWLLFCVVFFSCADKSQTKTDEQQEQSTEVGKLEGVWELVSYYNYDEDGRTDTIKASASNKQIKMYSKSKIMWTRFRATDTIDWFGYGSYTNTDSTLTEILEYGSKSMNTVIAEQPEFTFKLIIDENTFSQYEVDDQGNPLFAENYRRIDN